MGKIKSGDFCLIGFVLLLEFFLIFFFVFSTGNGDKVIIKTNEEIITKNLSENTSLEINSNGISLCIVIENGCVFVEHSDCKNQVCVNTGRISKNGQTIVCSPANMIISIESGKKENEYDKIVG